MLELFYWLFPFLDERLGGKKRSPEWSKVRAKHLETQPLCQVCGRKSKFLKANQVHHLQPFFLKPELELSPKNLITLCPEHHLLFGHLMFFGSYSLTCKEDCAKFKEKIKNRP